MTCLVNICSDLSIARNVMQLAGRNRAFEAKRFSSMRQAVRYTRRKTQLCHLLVSVWRQNILFYQTYRIKRCYVHVCVCYIFTLPETADSNGWISILIYQNVWNNTRATFNPHIIMGSKYNSDANFCIFYMLHN